MTATSPWIGAIASWLVEVYGLATILLFAASLAILRLKQPANRLAVARATFVGLTLLGPLVAACRFARGSTLFEPIPADLCCAPAIAPADPGSAAIVGLFAIGSTSSIGWLVVGAVASARLLRHSRPAPEPIRAILAKVAGQGSSPPRLLVGPGVAQPVAVGLVRPAIVLPGWFADGEPGRRIELALAHEWAHVNNGDLRLLALSRALLPLLFAHPLFAWIRQRVRADQEVLADLAASRTEGRIAYAEALLDWSRSSRRDTQGVARLAPALGLWERPSLLRRRVAVLLDGNSRLEARCSSRWRILVSTATFASLVALGAVAARGPIEGVPRSHSHVLPLILDLECPSNVVFCCPEPRNGR